MGRAVMSVESIFSETVEVCGFYAGELLPMRVDYDNHCIHLGGYTIDPLTEDGELVTYIVSPPEGPTLMTLDLHSFFRAVLEWEGSDGL